MPERTLANGVRLEIPAGALSEDVELTLHVAPPAREAWDDETKRPLGPVVEITPAVQSQGEPFMLSAPANPIPDGYHTITPYLVVSDCAKELDFVKKAFGAKPLMEPMTGPGGKIMHTEVKIGDSPLMMGESSDKHPAMPSMINLYVENSDAVYDRALKAGATPTTGELTRGAMKTTQWSSTSRC